ncbi:MAG: hypothetical protein Q8867_04855 [Bacteroidota bacterium]|nr:hypothetical protein [Bacteroidota bacterium]
MRSSRILVLSVVLVPFLFSCNKNLNVNANWKDITVVYGLLDQNDSAHYLKVTKAFLGDGNALSFAKIPDSSYYRDSLEIRMEEWNYSTLLRTFIFHDTLISNKEAGDSIFYYPDQHVFVTYGKLNAEYTYKLFIRNKHTGKEITSKTVLVKKFSIDKPASYPAQASFDSSRSSELKWTSAVNGRRYQLVIRFHYIEAQKADTSKRTDKYVDWVVFKDMLSSDLDGKTTMTYSLPGSVFYIVLGGNIKPDNTVTRAARDVSYIFSVASDDLSTYIDVTEPSSSIIQERPQFTNITGGIGIFASRHNNTKDNTKTLRLSETTLRQLKINSHTSNLGF